jgi:hypothetical protein
MSEFTAKNNSLLQPPKNRTAFQHSPPDQEAARQKFVCSEESENYAQSLQNLLLNGLHANAAHPTIIEFGSGTGEPVIAALLNSGFTGIIHGYEVNSGAAHIARQLVSGLGLSRQYIIHTGSFFDASDIPQADYLIANPPYIPADNPADLILPGLCGGPNGNSVAERILDAGYPNVCLEVSSYSNPSALIQHAQTLGYSLTRYSVTDLPLGIYSGQPVVMNRIRQMQSEGRAFLVGDHYSVGSAFFTKRPDGDPDLSFEFYLTLTDKYVTPDFQPKLASESNSGSAPSPHALTRR